MASIMATLGARSLPPQGLLGRASKPPIQESLDPGAHGLLVLAEVARYPGHTPARVREAHHLQSIAISSGASIEDT